MGRSNGGGGVTAPGLGAMMGNGNFPSATASMLYLINEVRAEW